MTPAEPDPAAGGAPLDRVPAEVTQPPSETPPAAPAAAPQAADEPGAGAGADPGRRARPLVRHQRLDRQALSDPIGLDGADPAERRPGAREPLHLPVPRPAQG